MKQISIQKRDMELLRTLGRVVLMDRAMIQARFFPLDQSGKACATRLRLLKDHGFIDRITFPIASFTDAPAELLACFRLTAAGADLLASLTGRGPERLLRTDPKSQTLLHRRDLARVILAVDQAVALAALPEAQWILEQDQRPGVRRKASRPQRFVLYEDFKSADGEVLQLRPDASCCLRFPGKATGTWHELLLWWEIDRSTEGHRVTEKLPGYQVLFREEEAGADSEARRVWHRHWPNVEHPTLRLFFVCPSPQRLETINALFRTLPGAEFVRLTTFDALTPEAVLRSPIWYNVLGNAHAIYPAAK